MNAATLIEAFDRAKDKARETWSHDEVVQIIQGLEDLTLNYIGGVSPKGFSKKTPERIEVGNLTKWG